MGRVAPPTLPLGFPPPSRPRPGRGAAQCSRPRVCGVGAGPPAPAPAPLPRGLLAGGGFPAPSRPFPPQRKSEMGISDISRFGGPSGWWAACALTGGGRGHRAPAPRASGLGFRRSAQGSALPRRREPAPPVSARPRGASSPPCPARAFLVCAVLRCWSAPARSARVPWASGGMFVPSSCAPGASGGGPARGFPPRVRAVPLPPPPVWAARRGRWARSAPAPRAPRPRVGGAHVARAPRPCPAALRYSPPSAAPSRRSAPGVSAAPSGLPGGRVCWPPGRGPGPCWGLLLAVGMLFVRPLGALRWRGLLLVWYCWWLVFGFVAAPPWGACFCRSFVLGGVSVLSQRGGGLAPCRGPGPGFGACGRGVSCLPWVCCLCARWARCGGGVFCCCLSEAAPRVFRPRWAVVPRPWRATPAHRGLVRSGVASSPLPRRFLAASSPLQLRKKFCHVENCSYFCRRYG